MMMMMSAAKNGFLFTNRISFISLRSKIMLSSLADGYDESEIQKMSKKGIISFFKFHLAAEAQLKAKDDQINNFKISTLTAKYMKLKGNLNVRGLIEEFEQSELFKQCRKRLTVKVTVTDEESKKTSVEYRTPSRKVLWDVALQEREYASLLACIENSNPERRDTVGERIRDLYSSASKIIHKPGDNDAILILKNRLFDHEVSGIYKFLITIRYYECCSICFRSSWLSASANTSMFYTNMRMGLPLKKTLTSCRRRRRRTRRRRAKSSGQ